MKLGIFCIVSYLFFAGIIFGALLMSEVTGELLFSGWTRDAVEELIGANDVDAEANPNLVFGDHIATAQAIGTMLLQVGTGGVVSDVMLGMPFFNHDYIMAAVRFYYTFSLFGLIMAMLGRFESF